MVWFAYSEGVSEEMMTYTYEQIAGMIDHSLLNPVLTEKELVEGIRLARTYRIASVCIIPFFLTTCVAMLKGSSVKPTTTVGFPHGGHLTRIKVAEAEQALHDGAEELDMVVNINKVLGNDWDYVFKEIKTIYDRVHGPGKKLKVIFENCYLHKSHKIRLCEICGKIGVDWVKTSTGYGSGGATFEDVKLMRQHTPPHVRLKAAGGIRDLDTVLEMRDLGVDRIGASRTQAILDECMSRLSIT
jgi:deoxyribose-phosphate aldolase